MTITSVGYGDIVPVRFQEHIVGIILQHNGPQPGMEQALSKFLNFERCIRRFAVKLAQSLCLRVN